LLPACRDGVGEEALALGNVIETTSGEDTWLGGVMPPN
jgi:hypothetical protein